jgi:ribosomal protein S18 acetylase RimI-like enzyme
MVADSTLRPIRIEAGVRPLDVTRDLGEVVALMQLAFGDSLDPAARAALRDMRRLQAPTFWAWLQRQAYWWSQPFPPGFVWVADGRVVGNASIRPAEAPGGWVIGNVAVSPEYRRRGIGRALMSAAIGLAEMRTGRWVALQVEEGNAVAQRLYHSMGFRTLGTVARWVREVGAGPAGAVPEKAAGLVRARRGGEWWREYELAHAVQNPALASIEPVHAQQFRPGFSVDLGRWLDGTIVHDGLAVIDGAIVGAVRVYAPGPLSARDAREARLELYMHPDWRGHVEPALLAYGLRRFSRSGALAVRVDAPAGETAAEEALRASGFTPVRALTTMRLDIKRGVA